MTDFPRLIEHAFPLKQASIDSVHEKNVRHGHISTLHIWPARRPLAACRAALIATLLPDPGDAEKRKELCEKIAGKLVKKVEKKKMPNGQTVERIKEETEGGILHWGRETENAETLEWFREEIRKAYGGRAPKVLDPFAGGGAIPLEAMRLGCEATAVDINPVAWFILKCTLEYPQKLAGQTRPLPEFVLHNDDFMAEFFKKAKGYGKAETRKAIKRLHELLNKKAKWNTKPDQQHLKFEDDEAGETSELEADLAWHVRAWGQWVLDRARRELAGFYPTYADFEPLKKDHIAYEHQPMRLVPSKDDGTLDIDSLNADFTDDYLEDKRNPRWVAKPPVAYLWARTITCKNCRRTIPILKTLWLCRKGTKRVLLHVADEGAGGLAFQVEHNVPVRGGNTAQRREHDKRLGQGTMSKAGAKCPNCPATMTKEDLQVEGKAGNLGLVMTAVIVDGQKTKEYRLPTDEERTSYGKALDAVETVFEGIPFGVPAEPIQTNAKGDTWCVNYGIDQFYKLFQDRQLLSLGVVARAIRAVSTELASAPGERTAWDDAVSAYIYCCLARLADRNSEVCTWQVGADKIGHTFTRYALPFTWDFVEVMPWANSSGGFLQAVEWVAKVASHLGDAASSSPAATAQNGSAIAQAYEDFDLIVTDPPYYDAIGYGVVMDFFAVWLKRTMSGVVSGVEDSLVDLGKPKWDAEHGDGELVDDAQRHEGDKSKSKLVYEDGMARAFLAAHKSLRPEGRFVVVFAHKEPDAWETLVAAIIRAGFVVDASWPIMTERSSRMRSMGSADLSSSVWLVCKKRPATAKPGWDNKVLEEMKANIAVRLREYWDAGIRGPDFVWAATGPAMEAYSKHPVVRKANEPGPLSVGEFLNHVRRMVVDYVVGQVLTGEQGADVAAADRLDEVTAYYLLHRHDFGMDEAPVGACILYATACGLSDSELDRTWDVLTGGGKSNAATAESGDEDEEESPADGDDESSSGGSKVKLKPWNRRTGKSMGYEAPEGKPVPLIDRIHRVMHLWKSGDVQKVDEYLDDHALRRNELFKRVVQSLIELSTNSERSLLESISNHIGAKGAIPSRSAALPFGEDE